MTIKKIDIYVSIYGLKPGSRSIEFFITLASSARASSCWFSQQKLGKPSYLGYD